MNTTKSPSSSSFGMLPRLLAAGLVFLSMSQGMAATLTWATGAAGTWDTTTTTAWTPGPVAWTPGASNTDVASFTGGAYNVDIAAGVELSAGGISAGTGNAVTIRSGGSGASFTLAGATPTISTVGNVIFEIAVQGTNGLAKTGNGILRFNTAATYTGNTSLSLGQTTLSTLNALPTTTQLTMSSAIVTMQNNQSLSGLSGLSGNTIRNTTTSNWTLTITGGTNAFAGTLSETSTGTLGLTNSGGSLALTGTNNYKGSTIVSGGSLSLGSNLVNSGSVTVSGGTLASTVANVNLGLGATSMNSGAVTPGGVGTVGSFTLASGQNFSTTGGTLNFDLSSAISFDQIIGGGVGAFSLANTTLTLSGLTSTSGTYQLFTGFGGSNSVTGLTITGLSPGYTGSLDTAGLLTVVPEPSTWALLAFSLTTVIVMRRRAKRF